jgi:SpoIID/LytB domain protein
MAGRSARRTVVITVSAAVAAAAALGPSTAPAGAADPPPSIRVVGGGYGHGVGMGQYGAEGMARNGRTATQILRHYYSGVQVQRIDLKPKVNVLAGAGLGTVEVRPKGRTRLAFAVPGRPNPKPRPLVDGDIARIGTNGTSMFAKKIRGGKVVWERTFPGRTVARIRIPTERVTVVPTNRADFLGWYGETSREYRHGSVLLSVDRGNREATCRARLCTVIGRMSPQSYLFGLAEVPGSFHLNAQKAQAVAGRSFAAIRQGAPREPGVYHLRADVFDQYYRGWAHHANNQRWMRAVRQTKDFVLRYGNRTVQAYYSSSTGGHTEDSDYVWTSQPGYLQAVRDPADKVNVNQRHRWAYRYTLAEIGNWFGVSKVRNVRILGDVGESGRVDKATVRIVGATTKNISGPAFRSTINARAGSRVLWSTKFRIAEVIKP